MLYILAVSSGTSSVYIAEMQVAMDKSNFDCIVQVPCFVLHFHFTSPEKQVGFSPLMFCLWNAFFTLFYANHIFPALQTSKARNTMDHLMAFWAFKVIILCSKMRDNIIILWPDLEHKARIVKNLKELSFV